MFVFPNKTERSLKKGTGPYNSLLFPIVSKLLLICLIIVLNPMNRNERKTLGKVIIFLYHLSTKSGGLIQFCCIG